MQFWRCWWQRAKNHVRGKPLEYARHERYPEPGRHQFEDARWAVGEFNDLDLESGFAA